MAKFLPGSLVSVVSGSIDSLTFRRSPGGATVGRRGLKCGQATMVQNSQKEAWAAARRLWYLQDDATRRAWATASQTYPWKDRLGQTRKLSGLQLWMRQVAWAGGTPYAPWALPPVAPTPAFASLAGSILGGNMVVSWVLAANPSVPVKLKIQGYRPGTLRPITSVRAWTPLHTTVSTWTNSIIIPPQSWPSEQAYAPGEYVRYRVTPMAYGHWLGSAGEIEVQYPV